ncbi:MAG TPA: malto-oligosyltrehalose synthase [Acetobacteraceae bacterium]|jgi:malto-oligosyltrehalose synthase
MRLQLRREFTFADAARAVPYLAELGVSHMYASPILTARPGSIHGYDVIDPTRVSEELGGEAGLRDLVAALRQAGLGLIVDIVPNHMAVGGGDNAWWQDVLRLGRDSRYACFFDIDWEPADPALHGKVLAPFLGRPYGEALAAGDLRLAGDPDGTPVVRYFDNSWPIAPRDLAEIAALGLAAYDPAAPDGRDRLHRLLERQHYRLAWWGTAGDEINWRRFFDINGLAGLRVEDPVVFEATHATIFRLYAEGLIDGLRIDHVDGLADPPGYCRALRARLDALARVRPDSAPSGPAWLVVEKILGAGESLPTDWGVDGTSGYDFMDQVSALQHDAAAEQSLGWFWSAVSGRPADFHVEERAARLETLRRGFDVQLEATASALHRLARLDPVTRDTSQAAIRRALLALLAHFPAYRTYNAGDDVRSASDDAAFLRALDAAKADSPGALHPVLDLLDRWLGGEPPATPGASWRRIATRRFQQLSAPVAAKAVEDTAFYRYGRLLSRNDVGFDAARLGCSVAEFHAACLARRRDFPDAMLATATHDHKRGEDLRARLAVLSECAEEWEAAVRRWIEANARLKQPGAVSTAAMPSIGDEAMLYQMIVGAWPTTLRAGDADGVAWFAERLAAWQEKALREAKLHTDWMAPNAAYEDAARGFLSALLAPGSRFLGEAAAWARRIGPAGAVNGLAQTLLKLTSPGVPDFFQGTEFWDLSLVDPDNRRPVDLAARHAALREAAPLPRLAGSWRDGRVKQALIARITTLRRAAPALFARGDYRPVEVRGPLADHVVAFLRTLGDAVCLTVVPRLPSRMVGDDDAIGLGARVWGETELLLPHGLSVLHDVLSDREFGGSGGVLPVRRVLGGLPVAVLVRLV